MGADNKEALSGRPLDVGERPQLPVQSMDVVRARLDDKSSDLENRTGEYRK